MWPKSIFKSLLSGAIKENHNLKAYLNIINNKYPDIYIKLPTWQNYKNLYRTSKKNFNSKSI